MSTLNHQLRATGHTLTDIKEEARAYKLRRGAKSARKMMSLSDLTITVDDFTEKYYLTKVAQGETGKIVWYLAKGLNSGK